MVIWMGQGEPAVRRAFLYTDIEGSTRLWECFPEAMPAALARHDTLLRDAVNNSQGRIFKTIGDAICAVFPTPEFALQAAIGAQTDFVEMDWQQTGISFPLKVRMAIHAGEVQERGVDFSGPVLIRLARLVDAAHGGQILIAGPVAALVRDSLPEGVELRDLGERRLRDVLGTERIFQLTIAALPSNFPPLKTLDSVAHNLPAAPTPCIGRDVERTRLRGLFPRSDVRLVTLVGPGGIGKTRLALQIATDLLDEFPDGVWFVDLAAVREPGLVTGTIGRSLGIREEAGRTSEELLVEWMKGRQTLLILDNCEQIVDEVASVAAQLSGAAPGLRLLVTSRSPLQIHGEHLLQVEPLALPEANQLPSISEFQDIASIRLFVDRARDVQPSFSVQEQNADDIAAICQLVDGIPLALELAAARAGTHSPRELRQRLDQRLATLSSGPRDLPERHQTLRGAIVWSYELLPDVEQEVFRKLAVFAGGWSQSAAAQVLDGDAGGDLLPKLTSLTRQSLVRAAPVLGDETRYSMLETIREFAVEQMIALEDAASLQQQHGAFFLDFAEQVLPRLYGSSLVKNLESVDLDYPNLRAAFSMFLESNVRDAQRLCNVMFRFWMVRGLITEGCTWYERALAPESPEPDAVRARSHQAFGSLLMHVSQYEDARVHFDISLALREELGVPRDIAIAKLGTGYLAIEQGNLELARIALAEALTVLQALDDHPGLGVCFMNLALLAKAEIRVADAGQAIRQASHHFSAAADAYGMKNAVCRHASIFRLAGDLDQASILTEEAAASYVEFNDDPGQAYVDHERAMIALQTGEPRDALRFARASLTRNMNLGDRKRTIECLATIANCFAELNQMTEAATLFGSAASLMRQLHVIPTPYDTWLCEPAFASVRASLGEAEFQANWQLGEQLTLGEATRLAERDEEERDLAMAPGYPPAVTNQRD